MAGLRSICVCVVSLLCMQTIHADPTTDLFGASWSGDVTAAAKAIKEGADVNAVDFRNNTPLWIAAHKGHDGVVELLLNNKADINYVDENTGQTALMGAVYGGSGKIKIIKELLAHGADTKVITDADIDESNISDADKKIIRSLIKPQRVGLQPVGIPSAPALPAVSEQEAWLMAMSEKERAAYEEEKKRSEAGEKWRAAGRAQFEAERKKGELRSGIMVMPRTAGQVVQDIFIFLDDSETWPKLGAITDSIWSALYSKVPIVVSASLLKIVFDPPSTASSQYKEEFRKKFQGYAKITSLEDKALANDIVQDSFKSDEWVMRQVSTSLVLLLPRWLVTSAGDATPIDPKDPKGFTKRELNLGLKIDRMKDLGDKKNLQAFLKSYQKSQNENYFINALTDLFVTGSEYKLNKVLNRKPQWTIYLTGHGNLGDTIASIPIRDFPKLLDFLETKVVTKLFIYSSCYAMGKNTQDVYKKEFPGQEHTYSFPIVVEATYDVPVSVEGPRFTFVNGNIALKFQENYAKFFDLTKFTSEPYDIAQAVQLIFPALNPDFFNDILSSNNFPHVRPIQRDTFISLFPGVEIGTTMTTSRTEPLDVGAAMENKNLISDQTYVLLRTTYVPFTLILRGKKQAPLLLSAIPGNAHHHISSIESYYPIKDVIESIMRPDYGASKVFWINEFVEKFSGGLTYHDVIINRPVTDNIVDLLVGRNRSTAYATGPQGVIIYAFDKGVLTESSPAPESGRSYMDRYRSVFSTDTPIISDVRQQEFEKLVMQAIDKNDSTKVRDLLKQGFSPTKAICDHARKVGNQLIIKMLEDALSTQQLQQQATPPQRSMGRFSRIGAK